MMKLDANCPSMEVVRGLVAYDKNTGVFSAIVQRGRKKAGDVLGYPDQLGYIKLGFHGKWVLAHRLAWRMEHGIWPEGEIDHINGNPSDNSIANLRVATRSQNGMNTRTGNGVCWHKNRKKWQVMVKANGKNHFVGMFINRTDADEAAIAAKLRLHGEFANITPPKPAPKQEQLL